MCRINAPAATNSGNVPECFQAPYPARGLPLGPLPVGQVCGGAAAVFSCSQASAGSADLAGPETALRSRRPTRLRNMRLRKEDELEATTSKCQASSLNRTMDNKEASTGSSFHQFGDNANDVGEAPAGLSTVVWSLLTPDVVNRRLTMEEALEYLTSSCGIVGGRDIDFLYFPGTFGKPYIKGYAILNFRDTKKAEQLVQSVPECSWGKRQGFESNVSHFLKRHGHIRNARYRPLVWPSAGDTVPTCLWGTEACPV